MVLSYTAGLLLMFRQVLTCIHKTKLVVRTKTGGGTGELFEFAAAKAASRLRLPPHSKIYAVTLTPCQKAM